MEGAVSSVIAYQSFIQQRRHYPDCLKQRIFQIFDHAMLSLPIPSSHDLLCLPLSISLPIYLMEYKVIMLGNLSVGKTALLHKFKKGQFLASTTSVAIDLISHRFEIAGTDINVQFWDTAGQEKYENITRQYYQKAHGSIIVVSAETPLGQNIKQLRKYLQLTSDECDEKKTCMILLNKKDLMAKNYFEETARKELQQLTEEYNCGQLKVVSALSSTQEELHNIIREFIKNIIKKDPSVDLPLSQATNIPSRLEQVMVKKREDKKEQKKCCQ